MFEHAPEIEVEQYKTGDRKKQRDLHTRVVQDGDQAIWLQGFEGQLDVAPGLFAGINRHQDMGLIGELAGCVCP